MHKINLINEFKVRNLIAQITNEKKIIHEINNKSISLYCGFDVTAESLHIGHILPLLCLKRFQEFGHKPIVLIGGATSLIGDPSFKTSERKLNSLELVSIWKNAIIEQISLFLDFNIHNSGKTIIDNYEWFKNFSLLKFLRIVGKNFSVNKMISKDAVKRRINRLDSGISFTEFSYNLLQAYDFSILYRKHNVILQVGGSDQWGNIISGIDLVRRLYGNEVFGLTLPLLVKKNGIKFGKTENNTIWLDKNKTSPYKFYQYWINISDYDICKFLRFFTNLDILKIDDIESCNSYIELNKYKLFLAEYLTKLVHGENGAKSAKRISSYLFHSNFVDIKKTDFFQLEQDGIPSVKISGIRDLKQVLVDSSLSVSRTQAKNMILANSIAINNIKKTDDMYVISKNDILYGRYTLLSRGKKKFCLICWEN
ncbi:MAG: tyrosine--tRNA ligase [Buchnera aphidicola (Schlechtendalia chinensis)]